MKVKHISILLGLAILCSTHAVTYAYLTDRKTEVNRIGITENEIHIEENFDPPDAVKPGSVIKKSPRIINDSQIPLYVRMAARFSSLEAEAACEPFSLGTGWSLASDGYYYYNSAVKAGEATTPLFPFVKIRSDADLEQIMPFDILIYAESVQSANRTMDEAWIYFERN